MAKSGAVNLSPRLTKHTAIKKSKKKGRRSFDTAIEYGTVAVIATENTVEWEMKRGRGPTTSPLVEPEVHLMLLTT
jgi:hypothetical protein